MKKYKIWIAIVGAGVLASLTTAASFFPDYKVLLVAAVAFLSAIMSFVVGKNDS